MQPEVLATLDELAGSDSLSRSAMVARLVEGEVARRASGDGPPLPEVVVDGVRWAPVVER